MAYIDDNLLAEGGRGAIGKKIVLKKTNGKTFITKYTDMSDVDYNST